MKGAGGGPMAASSGAIPTSHQASPSSTTTTPYSSGSHAVRQTPTPTPPAMSVSAPTVLTVKKEKTKTKDPKKKESKKQKKKKKKQTVSEKVPLMGKVKQAKMAHKMTKGLTWRQRWKLFKCYRKLSKLCSCCTSSS